MLDRFGQKYIRNLYFQNSLNVKHHFSLFCTVELKGIVTRRFVFFFFISFCKLNHLGLLDLGWTK